MNSYLKAYYASIAIGIPDKKASPGEPLNPTDNLLNINNKTGVSPLLFLKLKPCPVPLPDFDV
jgi:hypothetical protein